MYKVTEAATPILGLIKNTKVALNVHPEDLMGPHDEQTDGQISAVVFIREQNFISKATLKES